MVLVMLSVDDPTEPAPLVIKSYALRKSGFRRPQMAIKNAPARPKDGSAYLISHQLPPSSSPSVLHAISDPESAITSYLFQRQAAISRKQALVPNTSERVGYIVRL
jgi:hypothetical protein